MSALRAIPAAWSRLPPILPTTSSRAYRFGNGCFRYPSGCATSCKPIPPSRTWSCISFCRRWNRGYGPLARRSATRPAAVAFVHRFGALLNPHVHFHCVVVDGVFEAATEACESVRFHETPALSSEHQVDIQRKIRRRLMRALTRRGLLETDAADEMAAWDHGFSLDASVRIEAVDRSGLERLLRYCARPVFSLERLRQIDPEHRVYESIKPGPGGSVSLVLTPLELIERLAAPIPPPRRHRHRYYGVLAPNAPLRAAVTALARAKDEVAAHRTCTRSAAVGTAAGWTSRAGSRSASTTGAGLRVRSTRRLAGAETTEAEACRGTTCA